MDEIMCPVPNATIIPNTKWDKDEEFGFVMDAFVAYDILFVVSVTLLYLYCANKRTKKKVPHPEPPVIVDSQIASTTENKQSIIRFRSSSCPPLFTWEHKDPSEYTIDDAEEIFDRENEENPHQECPEEYTVGGYMPVEIGDTLEANGKYTIVRKLGYGHFSTVWLCYNNILSKYEAVKIIKSDDQYTATADDEIKMLRTTVSRNPRHPGYKFILQMIESFSLMSENGVHRCLTFEFMGPSLLTLLTQSGFQGIQEDAVKNIMKQVLQGLVYLHEECRIIHTDIKPENILICVKENHVARMAETVKRFKEFNIPMPASYLSSKAYEEQFSVFDRHNRLTARRNSLPRSKMPEDFEMQKIHFCRFRKSKSKGPLWVDPNIQIKIADLGNGCYENYHHTSQIQTLQYRALEVIIDAGYSFPADIWSVGCTTFELATGEYLFNPQSFSDLSTEEDHLGLIWELLDGIPTYIARSGRKSHLYFDEDGKFIHIRPEKLKIWKLEDVLVEKYKWKRIQAIPFAAFIEAMIEPDPELRATASSALQHMWLDENAD